MKERKIQSWLPLLLAIVMAAGMAGGYRIHRHMGNSDQPVSGGSIGALQQVMDLVKLKYVDTLSIDSIEFKGIEAILKKLDVHSVYIPASHLASVEEDLAGNFTGIGVEYQVISDTVFVVNAVENGPAAKHGFLPGDAIIAVNDSMIAGKKIDAAGLRNLLRGKKSSTVKVTLLRNGKRVEETISRGEIPYPSVESSYMVAPKIGYIRINRFSETTFLEFMDAATSLNEKGMKKLIIDLRGNTGGLLEEATKIADELLEDGLKIVTTKGARVKEQTTTATKPGLFETGDLVVLIDEQSASASEVLAGALQDHDRATIAGRRSFGKGLIQEQYKLANGSALRLTVARYFTPLGRSIQKGNIDRQMRLIENEMVKNGKQITDSATMKVFITKKGKKLYELGGISPDLQIPFDSALYPKPVMQLYKRNLYNAMALTTFREIGGSLASYNSPSQFDSTFLFTEPIWKKLNQVAEKDSVDLEKINLSEKNLIESRLKALMVRYRWRSPGYFEISNNHDPAVQTAIEFLKAPHP